MTRIGLFIGVAVLTLVATAATPGIAGDDQWLRGEIEVVETHIFRVGDRLIQLMGVDAPLAGQPCAPDLAYETDCGELHRLAVEQRFGGVKAQCRRVRGMEYREEPGGATCYHGPMNINAVLVARGLGMADRSETYRYVPHERFARETKSGLWRGDLVTVPRVWALCSNEWRYPYTSE